jgi:hypothetical protein
MKQATWKTGVVVISVLASLLLFGFYIPPLVWHSRHGNYVELQGVRYKLPLMYLEHSTVANELFITVSQNRFPVKLAEITLSMQKAYAIPETDDSMRDLGLQRSSSRALNVAGRESRCVEYAPATATRTAYIVRCTLADGLNAEYMGTPNAIPDFYAILQSGEAIQGKH